MYLQDHDGHRGYHTAELRHTRDARCGVDAERTTAGQLLAERGATDESEQHETHEGREGTRADADVEPSPPVAQWWFVFRWLHETLVK